MAPQHRFPLPNYRRFFRWSLQRGEILAHQQASEPQATRTRFPNARKDEHDQFLRKRAIDLVDLPGYGYAKVAKSELGRWSEMINGYFDQYRFYALVVSLIDIRHPASKLDEQMIEFLKACELPFVIALTKADKVSKNQADKQIAALRKQLDLGPEVEMILTSSEKGTGMDALRKTILAACR
mgnify:CR=1 FL=1